MRKSIQTKSPSSQIGRPELETSNQKKSILFRSQSLSNENTDDLGGNDNHYTMYSQKSLKVVSICLNLLNLVKMTKQYVIV